MALFFSRAGDVISMRPDLVLNKQKKNPKRNQNVLFWLDMKVNQINFQPSELFSSNKIGLLNRVMFFCDIFMRVQFNWIAWCKEFYSV